MSADPLSSGPFGPAKVKNPPPKRPGADDWRPVPGKPHLEENGLGQWRTKDHPPPKIP